VTISTRTLLLAGVVAGPSFFAIVLAQAFARQGFDLVRLPLSLLSMGDAGWIQRTNFVASGALALMCALAMRRLRSFVGSLLPILIAIYAAGLVVAGIFSPDAALGFPPGAPEGVPATQSLHSQLHGYAFDIAFLALIVLGFVRTSIMGLLFFSAGDVAMGWLTLVSAKLRWQC
jgi:hypothetical protein